MLTITEISKTFRIKDKSFLALEKTSLQVEKGSFVSLLGPSGCGKSTLLKIVAGLIEPTSGQVHLDGRLITGPGPDRGMVFQSYTLFPWLTVERNVQFGLEIRGIPKKERQEIARRYLELIGLKGFEQALPINLSGGMQQRVAIARALANDPEILLMDEPFGALDAQTRTVMQELLTDLWEKTKKTIIFVTHDVDEAIFLGDVVYVMTARPGRVKAVIPINLPRPRGYELKTSEVFSRLKRDILQLIREETLKATGLSSVLAAPSS